VQIKRGDVVAVGVNKLELKNGVRHASKRLAPDTTLLRVTIPV
jgi:hypothetical protein